VAGDRTPDNWAVVPAEASTEPPATAAQPDALVVPTATPIATAGAVDVSVTST
jgi:hypothetical protein